MLYLLEKRSPYKDRRTGKLSKVINEKPKQAAIVTAGHIESSFLLQLLVHLLYLGNPYSCSHEIG